MESNTRMIISSHISPLTIHLCLGFWSSPMLRSQEGEVIPTTLSLSGSTQAWGFTVTILGGGHRLAPDHPSAASCCQAGSHLSWWSQTPMCCWNTARCLNALLKDWPSFKYLFAFCVKRVSKESSHTCENKYSSCESHFIFPVMEHKLCIVFLPQSLTANVGLQHCF